MAKRTKELDFEPMALGPEPDVRLLYSITLRNILSFGPDTPPLELRALNVLIGPNGAGKSNLLDCIGLLQSTSDKLAETVRTEGSVQEWLWKGGKKPTARVETVVTPLTVFRPALRYWFEFRESNLRFELAEERLEAEKSTTGQKKPFLFFGYEGNRPMVNTVDFNSGNAMDRATTELSGRVKRYLRREDVNPEQSILSQRKDSELYPELTYVGNALRQIRLYRSWTFGRSNPARDWQDTAGAVDYLSDSADNLALMLNRFENEPEIAARIQELLHELYEGITGFHVQVFGGKMQVKFTEGKFSIPASRLSDGTLRFLSLLAILLNPTPPPLICLEEPELGLHPDAVLAIGRLIKEASERTQLIISTHSDILVDILGQQPEDIIVCEKHEGATRLTRHTEPELRGWLERYSIGELWTRGHLGGNRW